MKYIKTFEILTQPDDFYTPEEMYYTSFKKNSIIPVPLRIHKYYHDKMETSDEIISFSIKLSNILNDLKIEYKVYYEHDDPEFEGMFFLFKNKDTIPFYLNVHHVSLTIEEYLKNWKVDEIPFNDIELYFYANNYNL